MEKIITDENDSDPKNNEKKDLNRKKVFISNLTVLTDSFYLNINSNYDYLVEKEKKSVIKRNLQKLSFLLKKII